MLTIIEPAQTCGACLASKEVYRAEFQDGLSGAFCMKCLNKMLLARVKNGGHSANGRANGQEAKLFALDSEEAD